MSDPRNSAVGQEGHLQLLQRRAVPKLIILDADLRIISAQHGALEFFTTFRGVGAPRAERLPQSVEDAVRHVTASWGDTDDPSLTTVSMPLPELVLRVARLSGPSGHCLAVTAERIATREDLRRAAIRFNLSERELDILVMLVRGKNAREIAASCYISPNTVKEHVKRIYVKVGANNRAEAIAQVLNWRP
jgi:DNA-binding CsgD family transcriptional regulator